MSQIQPDASLHPIVSSSLARRIIIPASKDVSHPVDLISTMQSLVLDQSHPIALEMTRETAQRGFFVRARDPIALRHLEAQLRARYPQAAFLPLAPADDPLRLDAGETLSLVELHTAQPSYLPLHIPPQPGGEMSSPSNDPLLGLLAALDAVPGGMRAICQIVLIPASPTWSRPYQRKALEHALEPERQRKHDRQFQARLQTGGAEAAAESAFFLISLVAISGLLIGWQRLKSSAVGQIIDTLLHGRFSTLGENQPWLIYSGGILVIGSLLLLIGLTFAWYRARRATTLYDMSQVATQTSWVAYHACLRLFVIGPAAPEVIDLKRFVARLRPRGAWRPSLPLRFRLWLQHWETWWPSQPANWQQVRQAGQQWRRSVSARGRYLWVGLRATWERQHTVRALAQSRREVLAGLIAAYRQFHLANGNYFRASWRSTALARRLVAHSSSSPEHMPWQKPTSWWHGLTKKSMLLTVDALAALWHLPAPSLVPDLAWIEHRRVRTRLVSPPLAEAARHLSPMGVSEHAGHRVPFCIPPTCLQQHMLIVGKSGEGKSTAIGQIAQAMMHQGGLTLIDPHGDVADRLLLVVPPHREKDVVLIDLADQLYAVALNPLDATLGRGRDKATSDLIKILAFLWANAWGARMENVFDYVLRTLSELNHRLVREDPISGPTRQYTLLDVMALLTNKAFCQALLKQIDDPFIQRWWHAYYDPLNETMQRERSDPVLSKVAKFENQLARRIIGQSQSSLHFSHFIQHENIVLVKLAKGEVGEDVARLVGATLLGLLNLALQEQGKLPEAERKHMNVIVDEFQVLHGVDWAALAELRKYGAMFCLATQSLEYLRDEQTPLLPTILANVQQLLCFAVSAQDAAMLAPELGVEPHDLLNLDPHLCYCKLTYAGHRQPAFSATFSPLETNSTSAAWATRVRDLSRSCYARPVGEVDAALLQALARTQQIASTDAPPRPGTPSRARQEDGYRGRKASDPRRTGNNKARSVPQAPDSFPTVSAEGNEPTTPLLSPLPWSEAVGTPREQAEVSLSTSPLDKEGLSS